MTCQWCLHYRRKRGGLPRCERPDGDGKILAVKGPNGCSHDVCKWFNPRKSCTTCSFRCPAEVKADRLDQFGLCDQWKLRQLSSWGGSRRRKRKPPDA